MKTIQAAAGKWHGILKHFGIPEEALRNVHQPCPLCGGNDRYRFDDKEGTGSYFCSGCGAGMGMDLLMKFTGMDFREAAKKVDEMVGNIEPQSNVISGNSAGRIDKILQGCKPISRDDAAGKYLISRGLPASRALMFNPSVAYYHDGKFKGKYSAMVARMTNAVGELCMLHITYLTHEGRKADVPSVKKYTKAIESIEGSHIRLTGIKQHIGIAEGIETALAVIKLYGIPCWASGSANFMESFKAPAGVEMVTVFGDTDPNYRGQAAAYTLAHKLVNTQNKIAIVELPSTEGDFADILSVQAVIA